MQLIVKELGVQIDLIVPDSGLLSWSGEFLKQAFERAAVVLCCREWRHCDEYRVRKCQRGGSSKNRSGTIFGPVTLAQITTASPVLYLSKDQSTLKAKDPVLSFIMCSSVDPPSLSSTTPSTTILHFLHSLYRPPERGYTSPKTRKYPPFRPLRALPARAVLVS